MQNIIYQIAAKRWRLRTPAISATPDKRLADYLQWLVAMPTVTDHIQANSDALNYVGMLLKNRGMHVNYHSWNGVGSLVATTRLTKKPALMLAAHIDVVPADDRMFTLREEDGKLYGRGVLDMKFALAAYLDILDGLGDSLKTYDLGIMLTTDEEIGGPSGVERLIETGYIPKVCVLPDGGDDWQIQLFSKGVLQVKISAAGTPAHGSRPWLGDNAIIKLMTALDSIRETFGKQNAGTNTINIGMISGGEAINQVPEHAEALIDIRVISEEEKTKILKKIRAICNTGSLDVSVLVDGATGNFSLSDPYIARFAKHINEVTGVEVIGSRTLGSSDARHFSKIGVPCISLYPVGGGHHGPEEWINKTSLYQFRDILLRFISDPSFRLVGTESNSRKNKRKPLTNR